jgi:hypothetical protein
MQTNAPYEPLSHLDEPAINRERRQEDRRKVYWPGQLAGDRRSITSRRADDLSGLSPAYLKELAGMSMDRVDPDAAYDRALGEGRN